MHGFRQDLRQCANRMLGFSDPHPPQLEEWRYKTAKMMSREIRLLQKQLRI